VVAAHVALTHQQQQQQQQQLNEGAWKTTIPIRSNR